MARKFGKTLEKRTTVQKGQGTDLPPQMAAVTPSDAVGSGRDAKLASAALALLVAADGAQGLICEADAFGWGKSDKDKDWAENRVLVLLARLESSHRKVIEALRAGDYWETVDPRGNTLRAE
jgi:hypothetical protein